MTDRDTLRLVAQELIHAAAIGDRQAGETSMVRVDGWAFDGQAEPRDIHVLAGILAHLAGRVAAQLYLETDYTWPEIWELVAGDTEP
jgi:hypothetical protein